MTFENPFVSSDEAEREEVREGSKTYDTEKGPVEVNWKTFEPSAEKEKKLAQAVLFLPGWAMTAESKSLEPLSQSFADYAGAPAYVVSTRLERVPDGGQLNDEAEAIRKFAEDNNLSDVVIAGHSQGGDKAIDLVNLLQNKNPDLKVKGLVLMDSVGLYEQGKVELAAKFAKDSTLDTPNSVVKKMAGAGKFFKGEKSFLPRSLKAGADVVFGIIREMGKSGTEYPKRFLSEVSNMAKFNEKIKDIRVPVVLVHGEDDPISAHEKIAPVDKPSEREEFLKDNLFKNSPYVKMVVAEKAGHHGVPLFRSESVARASLYMLERFYRSKEK